MCSDKRDKKKLTIDEDWIRNKAIEMHDMMISSKVCEYKCDFMTRCKDFIRSILQEVRYG